MEDASSSNILVSVFWLVLLLDNVLAFNWLQSRNKAIARRLSTFSNDVLGSIMSGGQVKPATIAPAKAAAPAAAPKKA